MKNSGWFTLAAALLVSWPAWGIAQENDKSDAARKKRVDELKAKDMRSRDANEGLKVGEKAPSFLLKSLDGKTETNLVELIKNKPVVLVFGSYS